MQFMNKYAVDATVCGILAVTLLQASLCLAAKGGNGGGKPGGGGDPPPPPPPSLPVSYSITAPAMPYTNFFLQGYNDLGAVVGWNLGGDGPDDARPVVYLPDVDTSQAYYLDQLPTFPGMPTEYNTWHPRGAIAINNLGDIGGNVEPFNNTNNTARASLFLRSTGTPEFVVLDLQDPDAEREWVAGLNDSGDTLIASRKTVNGARVESLYVGNIYDDPTSFEKLDVSVFGPYTGWNLPSNLMFSNRIGSGPALIASRLNNDVTGEADVVRMAIDGSSFEVFEPYTGNDGTFYDGFWLDVIDDINDNGDVTGPGQVYSKPGGKGTTNVFAARWDADTGLMEALGDSDAQSSGYYSALLNNTGEYIVSDGVNGSGDLLWHSEYGPDNGLVALTDLFDPAELNGISFNGTFELTDQDIATEWPTIYAVGDEIVDGVTHGRLLILTPELVSSALAATTTVPEPQTATLLAVLGMSLAGCYRFGRG